MRKITNEEGYEIIDTEKTDYEGNPVEICNSKGFGGTHVEVNAGYLTWEVFDELKRAMAEAERLWR